MFTTYDLANILTDSIYLRLINSHTLLSATLEKIKKQLL